MSARYRAPLWVPGGHAQTIVSARMVPRPHVAYRRERWETPDQDFIDVDFAQPEPLLADAPVLVLFHGLEGSAHSHYALSVMRHFVDLGWRALVVHFRGCSGVPNRQPRAYHSGDTEECDWILRRLSQRWPAAPLYAAGISLGGNVLARWAGERGSDACFVRAAASIGAPIDLVACGKVLGRGFNRVYTRMFLSTLRPKALDQIRRFPGLADEIAVRQARTLHQFDDAYTAPVHGYKDAVDYWTKASAKPVLRHIQLPYLLLNARNDPFVPAACLPTQAEVSSHVVLDQPRTGGHIGFVQGPWPGRLNFLPERLSDFFNPDLSLGL